MPDDQETPTTVEPLFVTTQRARKLLGELGETTFWNLVSRKLIRLVSYGRKRLVPYPEIKELARRIEAGELATGRKGFGNHEKAIANSIASRKRKAAASSVAQPEPPRPAAVGRSEAFNSKQHSGYEL